MKGMHGIAWKKLYQTEWHGIKLKEIIEKKGLSTSKRVVVNSDFYEEFYDRYIAGEGKLEDNYETEQKSIGKFLYSNYLKEGEKAVSLGCGIGLCEEEFIRQGFNIQLQECQEKSFKYLEKKGVVIPYKWVTTNLSILPEDEYDLVTMVHICYCFTDDELLDFYRNIKRILKKDGKLVIMTEAMSFWDIIKEKMSLNNIYRVYCRIIRKDDLLSESVFWGYLRTINRHRRLLKKFFVSVDQSIVGQDIIPSGRLSLFVCRN